jgi:AraC-like DNA-binding protein
VALCLSFGISKNLYRPIGNLIHTISTDGSRRFTSSGVANEIDYLNHVYKESMEKLDLYDRERYQYKDVMKHYWLNRLLLEELVMQPDELAALFKEMRIALPVDEEYALLYLKLDRYQEFRKRFSVNGSESIRFALLNIASEIIGRTWPNEGLDLKGDHVVLIIAVPRNKAEQWLRIEQDIAEIRDFFTPAFHVTFTASLSGRTDRWSALQQLYKQASEQAGQRFFLGHGTTVTPETAHKAARSKKETYSKGIEDRLVEAIGARHQKAADEALGCLFQEMEALDYPNALVSVIKLNETVRAALESASLSDFTPSLGHYLAEKETLQEIHTSMRSAILDALGSKGDEEPINHYLVDAVIDYVRQHYKDQSLSLTSIAAVMKTPSRRLSKLVKEAKGISINDYINEIRLAEAAELLIHTDLPIHEVVRQVGIPSETYFFSLFKKQFGTSPKEYAYRQRARLYKQNLPKEEL